MVAHALEVVGPGPLVALGPVDRPKTTCDLARIHIGVTDKDETGLAIEAAEQIRQWDLFRKPGIPVDPLVDAVVKIDMLEALEMARRAPYIARGVEPPAPPAPAR